MKRIHARSFDSDREETDFGNSGSTVPVINIDKADEIISNIPRFTWAREAIVNLGRRCICTYTLLDIGVNDGAFAASMFKRNCNPNDASSPRIRVDGIEADASAFKSASEVARVAKERGFVFNVHNMTFEEFKSDTKYDVITAFEVLEHVKDPLFCVEKIYDMLEIGGHFFMSVPEQNGPFGIADKNKFHYWCATAQSVMFTLFSDDRKWQFIQGFETNGILHFMMKKKDYMA